MLVMINNQNISYKFDAILTLGSNLVIIEFLLQMKMQNWIFHKYVLKNLTQIHLWLIYLSTVLPYKLKIAFYCVLNKD